MGLYAILLVFVVCYPLLLYDTIQCNWNFSIEEDIKIERQLKLLNKPAVRTIVNKYEDIYDCVGIDKQLAFVHRLFKNRISYDFEMKSFPMYNKTKKQEYLDRKVCPVGSVPIRRITKDDILRERLASEDRQINTTNRPGVFLAIARTKSGQVKYVGAVGFISLHNPKVLSNQFSTTRIKLQSGPNSIEAGWRVDPILYGDTRTRLFVRTDAGGCHCFNTRCGGFIHLNRKVPIDFAFSSVSLPGRPSYEVKIRIVRDNRNGNWNLIIWNNTYMGFWPSHLFTGLMTYIEWGGAVYTPLNLPSPQMGSGSIPIGDTFYDAYISKLQVVNEKGQTIDANYIEMYASSPLFFAVYDMGQLGGDWGRLIFYGGPRRRSVNRTLF